MFSQLTQQLSAITPMMPVQWHVDGFIWQKLYQHSTFKLFAYLQLRHQPPPQTCLGQADKPFGGRAQMVLKSTVYAQCGQVTMLQKVIRAEHQRGGF